jgi:hypothetical protein
MRRIYPVFLLIVLVCSVKSATAGFPIGKYRSLVIPSFNYYTSKDNWDSKGHKINGKPGTGFTSYSMGLYIGYGITRRLDVIANMSAPMQRSSYRTADKDSLVSQQSSGLGDMQIGLSYNLLNFNYGSYLSVVASGIIPLYNNSKKEVALGYGIGGAELKFTYTGNIGATFLKGCYYNLELGGKRYFDTQGPDVLFYTASLGFGLGKRNQLSFDVGGQNSYSTNKTFNPNLSVNRDYYFTKSDLSFGHIFTRRFYMFLSGFYTFQGRNAGLGYGGSVQTVFKF